MQFCQNQLKNLAFLGERVLIPTFPLRLGVMMRYQSVIVKALLFIGNFLVKIINTSLEQGVFPSAWKKTQLIALKKYRLRYLHLTSDL